MTDINKLLNTTAAGLLAQKLDAKDGNKDEKISGSIWNQFVEANEVGKKISEHGSISIINAMKSITTYVVREVHAKNKTEAEVVASFNEKADQLETSAPAESADPADKTAKTGGVAPADPSAPAAKTKPEAPVKPADPADNKAQVQADYESVKVTVPKQTVKTKMPENHAECQKIPKNRKEGKEVADKIRAAYNKYRASTNGPAINSAIADMKQALAQINKDNIAYVIKHFTNLAECIDDVDNLGYGFDKKEIIEYVLKPLGIKYDTNWTVAQMQEESIKASKKIQENDTKKLEAHNKQVEAHKKEHKAVENFNNNIRPKAQKTFDDATKFMAEVANMNPKPEIERDEGYAEAKLPDGRYITVLYDDDGKISDICISHDVALHTRTDGTTEDPEEVMFAKDEALYNIERGEPVYAKITSGYDFEKLKALAEKIFGKKE